MTRHLEQNQRALSPTEQSFFIADEICSLKFVMHCELVGELGEAALRVALAKVQARHPLLRMRLESDAGSPWFRPGAEAIPLRVIDGPPSAVTDEAEVELHTRFDDPRQPLIRCVWIRHAPGHGTLLTTFHHLIGDGISGALLLRNLMQALGGAELDTLPLADSMDSHVPAMARGIRGYAGLIRLGFRTLAKSLGRGPFRVLPVEQPAAFDQRRAAIRQLRLTPEVVGRLTDRARKEGTTLHGALGAAILLACHPEIGHAPAHVAFSSAVNMRGQFSPPVGDDLGLFAALAFSQHLVDGETGLWPLAREIKQGLDEAISAGQPFYGLTCIAPWIMHRHRQAGGGDAGRAAVARVISRGMIPAFGLTNIGKVALNTEAAPLRVESLGFAVSLSVLGACAFTAASTNGILCLNSIVMEPVVSRATQDRIVERLQDLLFRAAD